MVCGGTVHLIVGLAASPEVASSDNYTHVNAQSLDFRDLFANVSEFFGIDTRAVCARKSLAREFDYDAFVFWIELSHIVYIPYFSSI